MKAVLSNLDLLVEDAKWWNFKYLQAIECSIFFMAAVNFSWTMPKRYAVVMFPEVNYELSLGMENVKRESWRQSTSSPKVYTCIDHAYSMVTKYKQLNR
jgi:hypothetical protein